MFRGFYIILAVLCVTGFPILAQKINFDHLKEEFPEENAVHLKHSKFYTIDLKNKKVSIISENNEETMALTDAGAAYVNSKYIYTSTFVKNRVIDASTFIPNKSGNYKSFATHDIQEKSDVDKDVFYNDTRATVISYPGVTSSTFTKLVSEEEYKDAHVFGLFYFSSYIPVVHCEIKLKVHKDIRIRYLLQNCSEKDFEFSKEEKGKFIYYTWLARNVKKYHLVDRAPNLRYYAPHIAFHVQDYVVNKDTVRLLDSPMDLYHWYTDMMKAVNTHPSQSLKAFSDSLVAGCKNEFEKVKRVLYWVQDNIKYIAFEEGTGTLVPREANSIYEKRYGDCKDMTSIITQLLRLAGVRSYMTWIGTRDIPYRFSELPSPITDNHMIAAYKDTTGKVWLLDATGKNAGIGFYTSMIQGKQAMIGIDSVHYELYDVPVIKKEKNLVRDSIVVELKQDLVSCRGKKELEGYPKVYFDYLNSNFTRKDLKESLRETLQKGNNTFNVDTFHIHNSESRELPTVIDYSCTVKNYLKSYDKEVFFNFHLDKRELSYLLNETRGAVPLELDNTIFENTWVTLTIPKNMEVTYIPENVSFRGRDYGFSIEYQKGPRMLTMKKHFYCDKLMIDPGDFEEWGKMLRTLNKAYNESIILKQK